MRVNDKMRVTNQSYEGYDEMRVKGNMRVNDQ